MPKFAGGDKIADMNRAGEEEERCPWESCGVVNLMRHC